MKILSFDVGIKNLAFCLIDISNNDKSNNYDICNWDIVNLCGEVPTCNYINKNKCCSNKAKFYKEGINVCKVHTKYFKYLIPSKVILNGSLIKKINKASINSLKEISLQLNLDIPEILFTLSNKSEIINKLYEFISEQFWEPINENKADNLDLISLGKTMKQKFDILFDEIPDVVLIENQISPIANRMKTLQGMIAQYFIDRNTDKIMFVSASNKLKEFNELSNKKIKTSYSERKKKSIEITKEEISDLDNNNTNKNKWNDYFNKHTKNDDLADCFLQALWFIRHSDMKSS